jgi:hypothetical protein
MEDAKEIKWEELVWRKKRKGWLLRDVWRELWGWGKMN